MARTNKPYIGRFAPSPTGPLHAGSLVAALASYLDALVHGGQWLLRIDDADLSRVQAGAAQTIVAQLQHYGFVWHGTPRHTQEQREAHAAAMVKLQTLGKVYACRCTRADLLHANISTLGERLYDRRCVQCVIGTQDTRALRLAVGDAHIEFIDRWAGAQTQRLSNAVGDFVLWRPTHVTGFPGGLYNYQLTMPVDDDAAGVTHVVRGADLLGNTARQLYVYDLLCLQGPVYMHVPILRQADGAKLSKQHGATALPMLPSTDVISLLNQALAHLGCVTSMATHARSFWRDATAAWAARLKDKGTV